MAMFHLSTKTISRSTGRTATASAAYRAGEKIHCERTGETHDYTRKGGVMATSAFMFDGDKKISLDRQNLWNVAEKSEKRKDARTAREIVVNLPHELNHEQRKALVDDFTKSLAKGLGVAIDYAIHEPNRKGDDRNYHAHIMMTTRTATMENGVLSLGTKSNIELENKALKAKGLPSTQAQITSIRKDWAEYTNHHLRKAGLDITIDHRSHKERGLEIAPTIKMGVAATAMERRGIETNKGNFNRAIQQANHELQMLNDEKIYKDSPAFQNIIDQLEQEQEWDNHPYALASEPPAPKPKPAEPAPEPPQLTALDLENIRNGWKKYDVEFAMSEAFSPTIDYVPTVHIAQKIEVDRVIGERLGVDSDYENQKKMIDDAFDRIANIATTPAPAPEPAPEQSRDDDYDFTM